MQRGLPCRPAACAAYFLLLWTLRLLGMYHCGSLDDGVYWWHALRGGPRPARGPLTSSRPRCPSGRRRCTRAAKCGRRTQKPGRLRSVAAVLCDVSFVDKARHAAGCGGVFGYCWSDNEICRCGRLRPGSAVACPSGRCACLVGVQHLPVSGRCL